MHPCAATTQPPGQHAWLEHCSQIGPPSAKQPPWARILFKLFCQQLHRSKRGDKWVVGHRTLLLKRTGNSAVVPMWHTCSGFDAAPLLPTQSHQVAGRLQGWAPQEGLARMAYFHMDSQNPVCTTCACTPHQAHPRTTQLRCAKGPASLPMSGQWHHCTLHTNTGHPRLHILHSHVCVGVNR